MYRDSNPKMENQMEKCKFNENLNFVFVADTCMTLL